MNFLSTDYLGKATGLMKEAFKFKKYKAMHPLAAVITGISMIPFVIIGLFLYACLVLDCLFFKLAKAAIDALHGVVNKEGKEVNSATQFIIYLISWPFLFLIYAYISLLALFINLYYAIVLCFTYIWTLGGFKFHIFAVEANDISKNIDSKYKALSTVYASLQVIILVLAPIVHGIILFCDLYYDYLERYFFDFFLIDYGIYFVTSVAFALLYSLIGFAPRPCNSKKKKLLPVKTEEIQKQ